MGGKRNEYKRKYQLALARKQREAYQFVKALAAMSRDSIRSNIAKIRDAAAEIVGTPRREKLRRCSRKAHTGFRCGLPARHKGPHVSDFCIDPACVCGAVTRRAQTKSRAA